MTGDGPSVTPNPEEAFINNRATLLGIAAILCWSLMIGLLRATMDAFGSQLGGALVYTLGALLLFAVNRPTPLHRISKKFLLTSGVFFVAYEVMLAIAVGLANSPTQTLEVSMLNYLWPTFTVLLWALANGRSRASAFLKVLPGALVATVGVALAVGGQDFLARGTAFGEFFVNPLPYVVAGIAALLWGLYNTVTPKVSDGSNAIAYYFTTVAVSLWIIFLAQGAPLPETFAATDLIPLIATAAAVAAGYALWGYAIVHGDTRTLSVASYATPVLSTVATTIILAAAPGPVFWVGAALVVVGSVVSWIGSQKAR